MAAGPNRDDGNIIEQQDLERSIRNLFHCRDGKSEYAMYFTFELPILYAEFVDRNRHVITDCSHEVLSARVQTIEENELAPTSEIVRLEEAIVDEAIDILNNKKELLKTLKEELISYKARCGRFRERINNRLGEVNARKAAQAAMARVQETPMDLSRGNRQEVVRERIEQEASLPIVRLRRFDQDQPQIVIQRCDAPARQLQPDPQPPIIPPPAVNEMADEQQLGIEMEPEVEAIEPDEVVMEVEDYSIDSTESTDTENGKGVNLINLVTLVDTQTVRNPKSKRKRKNIRGKSNGFAKRFVNKAKVIPNVRESTLSKIAQSNKVVSRSKSKQDEIYTQIFENTKQKSTLSKFKIGKKGDSVKSKINSEIENQSVNRSGALKVVKTIDVNSIKPGHYGEIDEIENAIYDQAINEFEAVQNAGNEGQNVHDWAEEVLANEIAQNVQQAQPLMQNVQPEVPVQQPIVEQVVNMDPLPQPIVWNNTRFGLEALQVLRDYGRDIIIRVRLHEDRPEKAMVHLSTDVRENVYGERAIMQWSGVYTHAVGVRTNPIPNIVCRLDGAPFVYTGLRRQYSLRLFPYIDLEDDAIIATGWLVPPLGHTPDFSLERVVLGEDFLRENLHSINPGLMEVTLRAENGHLIRFLLEAEILDWSPRPQLVKRALAPLGSSCVRLASEAHRVSRNQKAVSNRIPATEKKKTEINHRVLKYQRNLE
ncbi:hypothetical protein V9T40_005571 [Parthenolecanium corni]|uniref:Uncharacterized protein n=1 Tax=Parthenolecanium corni TaxID=536013 RepID=A0AAN9YB68_9HEMI